MYAKRYVLRKKQTICHDTIMVYYGLPYQVLHQSIAHSFECMEQETVLGDWKKI